MSGRHTVGTGGCAAVGVVTELVDVHATLGVCIVAVDLVGDGGRGRVVGLFEGDGSVDFGVPAEDCDCVMKRWMSVNDIDLRHGMTRVQWFGERQLDQTATVVTMEFAVSGERADSRPTSGCGVLATGVAIDSRNVQSRDSPALTILMIAFSCYYLAFLRRWNCVMDVSITGGCSSFGGLWWGCPPRICHHFTFFIRYQGRYPTNGNQTNLVQQTFIN